MSFKANETYRSLLLGFSLSIIFAGLIVLGLFIAPVHILKAKEAIFKDIKGHWASDSIAWAVQKGIVNGYPDNTFLPNNKVTYAEFLAMLLGAFPGIELDKGGKWYEGYYRYAEAMNWPVVEADHNKAIDRGDVARIVAASQGKLMNVNDAIQLLLDQGLSKGKTAPTIEGYEKDEPLLRGESIQFIKNLLDHNMKLTGIVAQIESASIVIDSCTTRRIDIGSSVDILIAKWGEPARKDISEYGFEWFIYNQDYTCYVQVGVSDGQIVALYTNAEGWEFIGGIKVGSSRPEVLEALGEKVNKIKKGNTIFEIAYNDHVDLFLYSGVYIYVFYDRHQNDTVTAMQYIEEAMELSLMGYHGLPTDRLRDSFELELFDLANAIRVRFGHEPLKWDDTMAATTRRHSKDMAEKHYFSHHDPDGTTPFDRMKAAGIVYKLAAENIAAGQTSAIFAHENWMNSTSGHRDNILGEFDRLGTGVHLGGEMSTYYTQGFYTPMVK